MCIFLDLWATLLLCVYGIYYTKFLILHDASKCYHKKNKWSVLVLRRVSSIEQLKTNCCGGVLWGLEFCSSLHSILYKTSGFFLQLPAGI